MYTHTDTVLTSNDKVAWKSDMNWESGTSNQTTLAKKKKKLSTVFIWNLKEGVRFCKKKKKKRRWKKGQSQDVFKRVYRAGTRSSYFHRCIGKIYQIWRKQNAADESKAELEIWSQEEKSAEGNWTRWEKEKNAHECTHTHTHFVWNFDLCLTEREIKMCKDGQRRCGGGEMVVFSSYPQPLVCLIHNAFIL